MSKKLINKEQIIKSSAYNSLVCIRGNLRPVTSQGVIKLNKILISKPILKNPKFKYKY